MQVFHGVRPSQPPRPRVMHEVSAREGSREAFTGETTGWVSSCETGRIPRCRSSSLTRRQHPPRASGLRMEEPRAVGDPMHVETSFVRNLGRPHPCPARHAGPAHEGKRPNDEHARG